MERIPSYALFSADRGKTFAGDNFRTVIKKKCGAPSWRGGNAAKYFEMGSR